MDITGVSQEVEICKLDEQGTTEEYITGVEEGEDRVVLVEGDSSTSEEQVLGYLEVQPSQLQAVTEGGTIYLSSDDLDQHLILAQGEEGGEFIVVVGSEEEALAALASADGEIKLQALQEEHPNDVHAEVLLAKETEAAVLQSSNDGDLLVHQEIVHHPEKNVIEMETLDEEQCRTQEEIVTVETSLEVDSEGLASVECGNVHETVSTVEDVAQSMEIVQLDADKFTGHESPEIIHVDSDESIIVETIVESEVDHDESAQLPSVVEVEIDPQDDSSFEPKEEIGLVFVDDVNPTIKDTEQLAETIITETITEDNKHVEETVIDPQFILAESVQEDDEIQVIEYSSHSPSQPLEEEIVLCHDDKSLVEAKVHNEVEFDLQVDVVCLDQDNIAEQHVLNSDALSSPTLESNAKCNTDSDVELTPSEDLIKSGDTNERTVSKLPHGLNQLVEAAMTASNQESSKENTEELIQVSLSSNEVHLVVEKSEKVADNNLQSDVQCDDNILSKPNVKSSKFQEIVILSSEESEKCNFEENTTIQTFKDNKVAEPQINEKSPLKVTQSTVIQLAPKDRTVVKKPNSPTHAASQILEQKNGETLSVLVHPTQETIHEDSDLNSHEFSNNKELSQKSEIPPEIPKQNKSTKSFIQDISPVDRCKPAIVRLCRVDAPVVKKELNKQIVSDLCSDKKLNKQEQAPISEEVIVIKDNFNVTESSGKEPIEPTSNDHCTVSVILKTKSAEVKNTSNSKGSFLSKQSTPSGSSIRSASPSIKKDSPKKSKLNTKEISLINTESRSESTSISLEKTTFQSSLKIVDDNVTEKEVAETRQDQNDHRTEETSLRNDSGDSKGDKNSDSTTRGRTKSQPSFNKQSDVRKETEKLDSGVRKKEVLIQETLDIDNVDNIVTKEVAETRQDQTDHQAEETSHKTDSDVSKDERNTHRGTRGGRKSLLASNKQSDVKNETENLDTTEGRKGVLIRETVKPSEVDKVNSEEVTEISHYQTDHKTKESSQVTESNPDKTSRGRTRSQFSSNKESDTTKEVENPGTTRGAKTVLKLAPVKLSELVNVNVAETKPDHKAGESLERTDSHFSKSESSTDRNTRGRTKSHLSSNKQSDVTKETENSSTTIGAEIGLIQDTVKPSKADNAMTKRAADTMQDQIDHKAEESSQTTDSGDSKDERNTDRTTRGRTRSQLSSDKQSDVSKETENLHNTGETKEEAFIKEPVKLSEVDNVDKVAETRQDQNDHKSESSKKTDLGDSNGENITGRSTRGRTRSHLSSNKQSDVMKETENSDNTGGRKEELIQEPAKPLEVDNGDKVMTKRAAETRQDENDRKAEKSSQKTDADSSKGESNTERTRGRTRSQITSNKQSDVTKEMENLDTTKEHVKPSEDDNGDTVMAKRAGETRQGRNDNNTEDSVDRTDSRDSKGDSNSDRITRGRTRSQLSSDRQRDVTKEIDNLDTTGGTEEVLIQEADKPSEVDLSVTNPVSKLVTEVSKQDENKEYSKSKRTRSTGLKTTPRPKESGNITKCDESKKSLSDMKTVSSKKLTKEDARLGSDTTDLSNLLGETISDAEETDSVNAEAATQSKQEPKKEKMSTKTRREIGTRNSPLLTVSSPKWKRDGTAEDLESTTEKDSKIRKKLLLKPNILLKGDRKPKVNKDKDEVGESKELISEAAEKDALQNTAETISQHAESSSLQVKKSSRKSLEVPKETPVSTRALRNQKNPPEQHSHKKSRKDAKEEPISTVKDNADVNKLPVTERKDVHDNVLISSKTLDTQTNVEEDEQEILPLHMRLGIDSSYPQSSFLPVTPNKDQNVLETLKSPSSSSLGKVVSVDTCIKEDWLTIQPVLLENNKDPILEEHQNNDEVNMVKDANLSELISEECKEQSLTLCDLETDGNLPLNLNSGEKPKDRTDSDVPIGTSTPNTTEQTGNKVFQKVDLPSEKKVRTRTSSRRTPILHSEKTNSTNQEAQPKPAIPKNVASDIPVDFVENAAKEDANGVADVTLVENESIKNSNGTAESEESKRVKLSKRKSLPANAVPDENVKKPKRVSFGGRGLKEKTADKLFDDMLKRTAKPVKSFTSLYTKGSVRRKRGSIGVILATPPKKKMAMTPGVKSFPKPRRKSSGGAGLSEEAYDSSDDDISAIVLRTYSGSKSPSRKTVPLPKKGIMMKHIKSSSNSTPKQENARTESGKGSQSVKKSPVKIQCQFHICCQGPSPPEMRSPTTMYNCKECHYRTCRIENIIQHYKECTLMLNQETLCWEKVGDKTPTRFSQEALKSNSPSVATAKGPLHGSYKSRRNLSKHFGDPAKTNSNDEKEAGGSEKSDDLSDGAESDNAESNVGSSSKTSFGFEENDIVWVDWKNDHWPALVQKIFPKQRKASVYLIENQVPEEGMKVHVRKLTPFDDAARNKLYLSKGGPNSAKVKAVQKAEDFLRKRVLGMKINPMQFFSNPNDVQGYLLGDSDEDEAQDTSPSLELVTVNQAETLPDKSAESPCPTKFSSPSKEELERIRQRLRAENRKIMDCINEGQVESHLIDVFQGRVPSVRHEKFHSSDDSVRDQLRHGTWFGPLETEDQRDEIIEYCMGLFKEKFDKQDNFDIVAYVFEVWIPEALIQAMMKVYNLAAAEAEARFARGSDWLPQDLLLHQEAEELCREPGLLDPLSSKRQMVIEKLRAIGIQEELLQTVPPTPLYRFI